MDENNEVQGFNLFIGLLVALGIEIVVIGITVLLIWLLV